MLSGVAEVEAVLPLLLQQPAQIVALRGTGVDRLVADASAASRGWVRVSGRVQRDNGVVEVQVRLADGRDHTQRITLAGARALGGGLVARAWAGATLAGYAADPVGNAARIGALSQQFGMVGADTSLLVLETLDDYLRYGIRAPAPLRADYDRLHAVRIGDEKQARAQRLDQIALQFAERERWWNTRWPKGAPATQPVLAKAAPMAVAAADAQVYMESRVSDVVTPPSPVSYTHLTLPTILRV